MKKLIAVLVVLLLVFSSVFADGLKSEESDTESILTGDLSEPGAEAASEGKDRPTVALVLSGGGAKGIAHIPIIEALERYGIPIDKVYGTSMGALIGGLYAAGLSPGEMREIVLGNDLTQLFTVFDSTGYTEVLDAFEYSTNNVLSISLGQGIGGVNGFIDDYLVLNFFNKYIGNVPENLDFDTDLVVPFECNAADMLTGDEVVFREGNLITAMRASMSLPLIFEPVILDDGSVFMDGGIVSNYIVHRAVQEGYDIIIVVTLNGYGKEKYTVDNYSSLSGTAGATLQTVLNNVSKGEVEMANFWFSPNLSGYNTLSFGEAAGILVRGEVEVEEQHAKLEDIAALFTEEQKVYKDPNRVGDYHTKFPEVSKEEHLSTREQRHEDLLGRTRISLGVYGSGGYGFYFKPDEDGIDQDTIRALFPVLSLRGFIKDLNGSRISLDIRLKLSLSRTTDFSVMSLLRLTPDLGERVYAFTRVRTEIGSRTFFTDKSEAASINNTIEGLVGVDAGLLLTNGKNHNIKAYVTGDNTWDLSNSNDEGRYAFVPSASFEAVFYPNYRNGLFSKTGGRIDLLTKVGYNTRNENWHYNLGIAAEYTFMLSDKVSFWFDATAFSARGDVSLRSSFSAYGGWNGMPGYASGILYGEFAYGGIGLQISLKSGFISNYLAILVRGGMKSDVWYDWFNTAMFESMVPFTEMKTWDLGISIGYGVSTPVGDLIFGAGFNKNMQLALYIEMT